MEILYLPHRMPYPPNKGDKIRSWHWLRELAREHTVHLATFIDDPADWAHRAKLDTLCASTCYRPLPSRRSRLRSLRGLIDGQPLSFAYYRDGALARFVDRLLAERPIDAVLVFSSAMAPYVAEYHDTRRVLDFVDVDSDKWRQYAGSMRTRALMRAVYAREATTLARAERALAAGFDASVFVSQAEADFFTRGAPGVAEHVHAIGNGVDADYFDPDAVVPEDVGGAPHVVFTGAMDYGANVDAVAWFVARVWPAVTQAVPGARLSIVGTRPTRTVTELAGPDITVTGAVADIRPWLAAADVAIAPMQIARGIQNKVLEALAMARPVVMSTAAAEGLAPTEASFARVVDTPADTADAVIAALDGRWAARPADGRAYVRRHYGWGAQGARLTALLAGTGENKTSAGTPDGAETVAGGRA